MLLLHAVKLCFLHNILVNVTNCNLLRHVITYGGAFQYIMLNHDRTKIV